MGGGVAAAGGGGAGAGSGDGTGPGLAGSEQAAPARRMAMAKRAEAEVRMVSRMVSPVTTIVPASDRGTLDRIAFAVRNGLHPRDSAVGVRSPLRCTAGGTAAA